MATSAYTNGYQPFGFNDFSGGLNLRDKSDAVGDKEAIDLLNVTFTERGAVRQRDGYTDLLAFDLGQRVDSLSPYYNAAGQRQLIAGCGPELVAIDASGTTVGARTGLAGGPYTFARFGDPGHEYLYAANGIDTFQRWDGAGWAGGDVLAKVNGVAGQAMPRGNALTVGAQQAGSTSGTNASNRLVATAFGTQTAAGPGGTPTTPSRVYFSNPGLPEEWETDGFDGTAGANYADRRGRNFIDLTPGDGERIMAAVTWRELVFVFKETKFFVLWGEGTGTDSHPTFQVREVVNAIGLAAPQAITVGRDGVYFMNRRGVYRTSGGDPTLLSDIVSPMWTQDPDPYFRSEPINLARLDLPRLLWHMERLYLAIPTGVSNVNDRVLVYDTQHQWWTLYDLPASALASFRSQVRADLHFGYSSGPLRVGRQELNRRVDRDDAVITSRWRSGWADYGSSQVRVLRETKVWGAGAAIVSFSTDFNVTLSAGLDRMFAPFTPWPGSGIWDQWLAPIAYQWPGAGQIAATLMRYAVRGTTFSTAFSNSPQTQSWSVHRVARHLREIREPSVR